MTLEGAARAAALLDAADVAASGDLVRMDSWSNEVWMGETHVVRIASRRGPESLAHELAVAGVLPATVPYPQPIATGWHEDVLWSVAPRVPGVPLHQAWATSDRNERVMLVARFAESMRALHAVVLPPALATPPPGGGGPPAAIAAMPDMVRTFVAEALDATAMPDGVADTVLHELMRAEDALSATPSVTVHTDLGFDNAIWDGERVWLLDLEWCWSGPADYELVHLLRYCHAPERTTDHGAVPGLLLDAYPELFGHERLRDRLLVYGLAGFARGWTWRQDLWRTSPDDPSHPSHDVLDFVRGGHWLGLLP